MAFSMTGWGTCRTPKLSVNIRGVNSKYREVYLHLPAELFSAEPMMYRYVSDAVTRGRVDVYVNINAALLRKKFTINENLYMEAYRSIGRLMKKTGDTGKPPAGFILGIEGVACARDAESMRIFTWEKVKPCIAKALKDFLKMKEAEGKRLVKDIEKHLAVVEESAEKIKKLYAEFKHDFTERARKKLAVLLEKDGKEAVIRSEVVEILDRYEVTEELVRIASHIRHFKEILAGKNPPGRKIDFLSQELNREANTIASKIPHAATAQAAIVIKESVEKIREQAQNNAERLP